MKHNVVAPSVGESITEVSILKWLKKNGQAVKSGELLLEIESDKATVEIIAESSGSLTILKPDGERIPVGEIIGVIDDAAQGTVESSPAPSAPKTSPSAPAAASAPTPAPAQAPAATTTGMTPGPAARKALAEKGLDASQVPGTGKDGRVTKGDVQQYTPQARTAAAPAVASIPTREGDRRVPMSNLRARIAERLVQAQHTAAILTTFNEADMGPVMSLRNQHKDAFKAKHGVALSFMSFFTRASIEALKVTPEVNASIDGRDVIYHDYQDIGIAVGTERGLVVPVVRDAGRMGFVEIEKKIAELAIKARDGKLSIADMSGGTFTISNGGVYGSLLSTPILNPPQSGILGMHKIQERPMAIQGKVEIRPMMYLALSYDHRLIDGKGAVTFLVTLKDFLEHPEKLGLEF
jgi:2-oxoglutarate dehydrogenase E2 component (dihydrolipoamide succinyltransferase)